MFGSVVAVEIILPWFHCRVLKLYTLSTGQFLGDCLWHRTTTRLHTWMQVHPVLVFFISWWHCQSLGHLREKSCILPHLTDLCILHIQVWNRIFFPLRILEHSNCARCNQVAMLMALPSQEPWSFSSGGGHCNVVVAGADSQLIFLLWPSLGMIDQCCTTCLHSCISCHALTLHLPWSQ
jgi:hypothetical protein